MKTTFNALFAPVVAFGLAAQPLVALGSDKIVERADRVLRLLAGENAKPLHFSPQPEVPGLTGATKIEYIDHKGERQTMYMLPDGEHAIMGRIYKLKAKDIAGLPPRTDKPAIQKAPTETIGEFHNSSTKGIVGETDNRKTYTPNTFLETSDFISALIPKAFGEIPKEKIPSVFMKTLSTAPAIVDGSSAKRIYVLFDPMCGYCVKEYNEYRKHIDAGEFSVSWILVQTASKPPYTYLKRLLDEGLTNEEKLAKLKSLMKSRPDPRKVVINNEKDSMNKLILNTSLMSLLRHTQDPTRMAGTPQTLFADKNGDLRHFLGKTEAEAILSEI